MAAGLTVPGPIGGGLSRAAAVRVGVSLDMRQRRAKMQGRRASSVESRYFLYIRTVKRRGSEAGIGEREGRSRRGWGGRGSHRGRLGEGGRVGFRALEHIRQGRARLVARGGRWEDDWPYRQGGNKGQRISISGAVCERSGSECCRQHGLLTR